MHRIFRHPLAFFIGAFLFGTADAAPLRYHVTPFQPTGIGTTISGFNDLGHAAGRTAVFNPELDHAVWVSFLSYGSGYVDLGQRGAQFEPAGLNNLDQVAGVARDAASGRVSAWLLTGRELAAIPSLGGHATVATGINDAGQVAGYASLSAWDYRAFVYQDGVTTAIGSPGGPERTSGAFGINAHGQVVGEWVDEHLHKRAFLYDAGIMTDLGTLGGSAARATGIGNGGHVVGQSETAAGVLRSFVWFNGGMTELASASGGWFSANGVNAAGDIVGAADGQAFIRIGEVLHNLNDALDPHAGWDLNDARAINDKGQIAAYGCSAAFGCGAVLLTPVPEADVLSMLLAGLALAALAARRARPGPPLRMRAGALLLLGAGASASVSAAVTPLSFTVAVLSDPLGRHYAVADINNNGQFAGTFNVAGGNGHAFVASGAQLRDLGTLGSWHSSARDLNNAGDVLGAADAPVSGAPRAFLYSRGAMHDIGTLGGDYTYPAALNDAGQAVGFSRTLAGKEHAFLYSNGSMSDLGTLAAHGDLSYASDINNAGQIAGHWVDRQGYQRAFLYEHGAMKDLGTLGGRWSYGTAINDAGHMVGVAETAGGQIRAFLLRGTNMTDLGSLGGGASQAFDINNSGDIIGMAFGGAAAAFLWRDGVMGDINDYLVPGSGLGIVAVSRINDLGQILATGCHSGVCHPVLLTPVPEPAAAWLLLAGLALAALKRRALPA